MLILGVTGGVDSLFDISGATKGLGHDSAAVLLKNGEVVCGIEEERLNRIKHTNKFCSSAIQFCLKAVENIKDLNAIAIYASESFLNIKLKEFALHVQELSVFSDIRQYYQYLFEKHTGILFEREQFYFVKHHLAHAAGSYYLSGFKSCLILAIDGEGEDISAMVISADNKAFNILKTKSVADSLGHFYLKVIAFLGYKDFDEYKVMGLAPYGNPAVYRDQFKQFYELIADGDFRIDQDKILQLYDVLAPRRRGEPFSQIHKDIAAALQEALETIVFHTLRHYQELTGLRRLVISGGVGQNSSLNGKILYSGLFDEVYVPSFAGDSGCAYGAAAYTAHQLEPELPQKQVSQCYWGSFAEDAEVEAALNAWNAFVEIEKLTDRSEQVSDLIMQGAVIGWVQGSSEFGPRALGNRSIIADPRLDSHKETINAMVKMRESYRPFAPSVIAERVQDFFEVPGIQTSFPFMSFVLKVKPEWRSQLGAITHVDGSARLQTVNQQDNPRYWSLINTFGKKTGIPILLNTSFNNHAEPIVDSVNDAVVCFLTTGLNFLVVGDFLVSKRDHRGEDLANLKLNFPKAAMLTQEIRHIDWETVSDECVLNWNYDRSRRFSLPRAWFSLLQAAKNGGTVNELMDKLAFTEELRQSVFETIAQMWSDRLIELHP